MFGKNNTSLRPVSIIGVGETKMGKLPDRTLRDLITQAGTTAMQDAGIEADQIESLFMGNFNSGYLCNQNHMGALASEVLGLGTTPTIRVEGACASGSLALRQGMIAVASGLCDIVLVGGVEKMTHRSTEEVTTAVASAADSVLEFGVGATFPAIFAQLANRYMYEYGNCREAMALCAIQNHAHALLNPDAQLHKAITLENVLNGFPIADPLTIFDCSLVTDGAAFVVLAATEVAASLGKPARHIKIKGSGHAGDSLTVASKKSLTTMAATVDAAQQAFRASKLSPADISLVELHDCFTITQLITMEDLGFFEKGTGAQAILDGKTTRNGKIPVNVSGGLKAKGHPIGATGLSQIYELVTQLRGEAGERQLSTVNFGLAHNLGGTAATCVVTILGRE